ncbi:MAG: hypothetical protein ACREM2_03895, partial [Vulcanimicrobiaceae bacterium]
RTLRSRCRPCSARPARSWRSAARCCLRSPVRWPRPSPSAGSAAYLGSLHAQFVAERFLAIQVTPSAALWAMGVPAALAGRLALPLACAVVAVLTVQLLSKRYDPSACLVLACAALPLAQPFAHEQDLVLALIPAIALARRARGKLWYVGAIGSLAVAINWLALAESPAALGQQIALAVAACGALAALAPTQATAPRALRAFAALGVLGLCAVVAVVAFGSYAGEHPLPVWPDAFRAALAIPPAPSNAVAWHLEQVAAGTTRRVAAWGLLRALSLAACALLWAAASIALTSRARSGVGSDVHADRERDLLPHGT